MTTLNATISSTLKHWYLPLIVGILFIVFGAYIFTVPLEAYVTLSILFSLSFFFSGITEIFFAVTNKDSIEGWGWYLVGGILTSLFGTYLIIYPGISMATLPFIVGFAFLFRSSQGLGFAFDLKKGGLPWGGLAFISVLGILFSFLLLANPVIASASIVVMTALSIITVGSYSILLALTLKKVKDLPAKR
jgi:uncharacterized membrane protein HdeD (DUF308 family)